MRGPLPFPGARRTARPVLVLLVALVALVSTQAAYAPPAEARPGLGTVRDYRVTLTEAEVLTVDVLGVDDPAAGRTWVRSSVCLFDGGCARRVTRDGLTAAVNADGTITTYRTAADGGSTPGVPSSRVALGYTVTDSGGGRYGAQLLITAEPTTGVRPGEPDPALRARLRVTPWKRYVYFDHAGQRVALTSAVHNTGNLPLTGLTLTNASPNVPAATCSPVAVGGTLPAGASTTCTVALVVTQDLVDGNVQRTNTLTATGRAVRAGVTYAAVAGGISTASPIQRPGLALTASASPATVASPAQPVAYTVVARNRGLVTLRNLLVRAPFPGLAALVCAPVPQGGRLAPGESTTCRATRTLPSDRLGVATLSDTVRASAQTYLQTVNATSRVDLAVTVPRPTPPGPGTGPGPVARDDVVSTTVGHPLVVAVLANDAAGGASSPLVGSSVRLRLEPETRNGAVLHGDAKTIVIPALANRTAEPLVGGVAFLVSGRGEIIVVPLSDAPSVPFTIGYQVADADGRTTRATLTVGIGG